MNETGGYTWETFRPRLLSAIKAIFRSYPEDLAPFDPVGVQLRYLDAFPYNPEEDDPVRFLSEFLHTNVRVDPLLFEDQELLDRPSGLNLSLNFPLTKPRGLGVLSFVSGAKNGKPAIILETNIRSQNDDVPKKEDNFDAWLSDAHEVVDKWFFTLCRGKLLESFEPRYADE